MLLVCNLSEQVLSACLRVAFQRDFGFPVSDVFSPYHSSPYHSSVHELPPCAVISQPRGIWHDSSNPGNDSVPSSPCRVVVESYLKHETCVATTLFGHRKPDRAKKQTDMVSTGLRRCVAIYLAKLLVTLRGTGGFAKQMLHLQQVLSHESRWGVKRGSEDLHDQTWSTPKPWLWPPSIPSAPASRLQVGRCKWLASVFLSSGP